MARKGTYTATFTLDGHRYYAYGKTQDEADANAIRKETLLKANVRTSNSKYTVERWARKWLHDYKDGAVSVAWYKQMEGIMENHIFPEIGDMLIKDVTVADIKRLMNQKTDMSESHQKKIAQILLQIFVSAEENDIIVKVPTRQIKTAPRSNRSRTRPITEAERSLTLRTADKYPDEGLPFLIMLYCGCRPQEVARLKMADYDRKNGILRVHSARKADGTTGSPKSESGIREIPVPAYLAERLNKVKKKPNEYIVTSQEGKPLTKTTQKRLWHKFRRKMDIENGAQTFRGGIVQTTIADDLRPYCYRHTYCTDLQDAGVPLTVAKDLMGHSDIKMAANIYTHRSKISLEDARVKLDKLHSCSHVEK